MDSLLQGLTLLSAYLGDIQVSGVDEDHLRLQRLESTSLTLKKSKCTFGDFGLDFIIYLGHRMDFTPLLIKLKPLQKHHLILLTNHLSECIVTANTLAPVWKVLRMFPLLPHLLRLILWNLFNLRNQFISQHVFATLLIVILP